MGFRDDAYALRARVQVLERDLRRAEARSDDAEQEIRELRDTIRNLRQGLANDEMLRRDPHYTITQTLLPVAGFFGAVIAVATPTLFFPYPWAGHLELTPDGLSFFASQLADGGLATILATACTLPLAVLPAVAMAGLHRRRSWGWGVGMLGFMAWSVLCPPLGIYGLYALGRSAVRNAFFTPPTAAVIVDDHGIVDDRPLDAHAPPMRVSDVDTTQIPRDEVVLLEDAERAVERSATRR